MFSKLASLDSTIPRDAVNALPKIAVVAPCFNEVDSLARLALALEGLRNDLAGKYEVEFVLVDDGSRDATWQLLSEHYRDRNDARLIRHPVNRGIAAAIATGIAAANSEIVASIDADCTYDPRQIQQMLPLLAADVDLVVASPYHPSGAVAGVASWRLAISKLASRMYRLVLRNKLHTYTSCFRVYRRAAIRDLPPVNPGFVGIAELVWQLDRRGSRIAECPAVLTVRTTGQSKMRVARVALAHLKLLTRAAFDRLFSPRCHATRSGESLLSTSSITTSSSTT